MSTMTPCQYVVPVASSSTTAAFSLTQTTLPSAAIIRYSALSGISSRLASSSARRIRSASSRCRIWSHSSPSPSQSLSG